MTDGETGNDEIDDDAGPNSQITALCIGEYRQNDWRRVWNSNFESISRVFREYVMSAGRRIFGDRHGLALFCAALSFFALSWRIGVLINDSYTVANTLVAVSEGQLHVERAVYGPGLETPGMVEVNGRAYGRNYGQIILTLPFLWVIQGIDIVADLRVALAGGWAMLLLGLFILVGDMLDRDVFERDSRTIASYVGSIVALSMFAVVVHGSTTIDPMWHHIIALQAQTMVAAGLIGVVIYRLLTRIHDWRIGLAAGLVVVFVTPIGLWSTFPKRHVFVSLGVIVSAYCLYRSREAIYGESARPWSLPLVRRTLEVSETTRWRALAYVPVGIVAWVNSLEGIILLASLLAVDLLTGGRRLGSLVAAGITCVVSLIPMFVTNFLIGGNPLEPPMAHGKYGRGGLAEQGGGGGATAGSTDGGTTSNRVIDSVQGVLTIVGDSLQKGTSVVASELDQVYFIFIRSGYVSETINGGDALRLSFIESMPIATALVVLPIVLWKIDLRQQMWTIIEERRISPVRTVDSFVIVYTVVATLMFLPWLGPNVQITVRYLLVLFPLSVYGIARLSSVQKIITRRYLTCIGVYLSGVLVGGQILALYLYASEAVLDESFQVHAYIGLGVSVLVAGWIIMDVMGYRDDRLGASILGLAAATGTVFLLLAKLWYFADIGPFTLPIL